MGWHSLDSCCSGYGQVLVSREHSIYE